MSAPGAGRGGGAFVPRPLVGILLMMAAASLFPVMTGIAKLLSERYASEQVIWARNASHLVFVLALFWPGRGLSLLRAQRPLVQVARSLVLLMSTVCAFVAVKHIALGKAATIQFVTPFIVTLLACAFLGERLVLARVAAVCAGFLGVVVVIRPGVDSFQWWDLLPLAGARFYAAYQVLTRFVAGKDSPETSVVYSALVGTAAMTVFLPFGWTTPVDAFDAIVMASFGILGGVGHYCLARAMRHAEASVISPFNYWQIVGSSLFGFVVFGEVPDRHVWIGAALIVAAGIFMAWQERRGGAAA
ncbi:MAG: DMT family transporter [Alphaproteobacteria bacterium]